MVTIGQVGYFLVAWYVPAHLATDPIRERKTLIPCSGRYDCGLCANLRHVFQIIK